MCLETRHFLPRLGRWRSLGLVSLTVGLLTAGGTLIDGSRQGTRSSAVALAQTAVSAAEIDQYANAILQMEPARSEAYTQIANLLLAANLDLNQVDIGCAQSNLTAAPRALRQEVDELRVGYCNQARDIVDQNGLTAQRFNEITTAHREDAAVVDLIRQSLTRLQQP